MYLFLVLDLSFPGLLGSMLAAIKKLAAGVWQKTGLDDTEDFSSSENAHVTRVSRSLGHDDRLNELNQRIQGYLGEDVGDPVDDTLRMIMDETERWDSSRNQSNFNARREYQYADSAADRNNGSIDIRNSAGDDELMAYALRLEANNSYLLDLIQRFDEISFQKKYHEVVETNAKLEAEVARLKSTNTKVYASYCDLVEEVRVLRSEKTRSARQMELLTSEIDQLKATRRRLASLETSYDRERPVSRTPILKTSTRSRQQNNPKDDDTMKLLREQWPIKRVVD